MGPSDFLRIMSTELERLHLRYFVTGSMATIVYGEPRLTIDIDLVLELPVEKIDEFCDSFPSPEFYCSRQAVSEAVSQHRQFNVIHPASGYKADLIVAEDSEFNRSRLTRRARIPGGKDFETWFASPEDVIVKKLEFYKKGGSDKHLRDIAGVLKVQGSRIDREYIEHWVSRLGVQAEWQTVIMQSRKTNEKLE